MKVIDLHQDLLLHMRGEGGVKANTQTSPEMLMASDVKLVVASVFIHPNRGAEGPRLIERELIQYEALARRYGWRIVRTGADVDDVLAGGSLGLLLHIEGLNIFPETGFAALERWYELGWRSLGPVWNSANDLGGGCGESGSGLTELGASVLEWCEQRDIIVDFAHANDRTFWNGVRARGNPAIVSHANAFNLCKHVRNLNDTQLLSIAMRDGLVGITFVNGFVVRLGRATIVQVADHIENIRGFIGSQHVAIGSDFGGILGTTVEGLGSVEDLPNLWDELARRGWSDDAIEQVAWRNAARVLKKILL